MAMYKKVLLLLCIHSVCGLVIVERDSRGNKDVTYTDTYVHTIELQDKSLGSNEIVVPLVSDDVIPALLSSNSRIRTLLLIVRLLMQVTTRLGLAEYAWRMSSDFMGGLLTLLFGPNVDVLVPIVTGIGNTVLRWLT